MKKTLLCLLAFSLLVGLTLPIFALDFPISTGIGKLADEAKIVKTACYGETIHFNVKDIKQGLCLTNFEDIVVVSLPNEETGKLYLANGEVRVGQSIMASSMHMLSFVPASEEIKESTFFITASHFAGGASIPCVLKFTDKHNQAPTSISESDAELTVQTSKNSLLFGRLSATDPEGDRLTFRIISTTEHGRLTLSDAKHGEYTYMPNKDFTGSDSFVYTVRDEWGNYAYLSTVNIKVKSPITDKVLEDMAESRAEHPALTLVGLNIMQAKLSGDGYYFLPEEEVSRGEFVVMAMKAAGVPVDKAHTETLFDDNASIDVAIRPYLATAQHKGYINGSFEENGLYFDASRPITRAEASVIIARILELEESESVKTFSDSSEIPVWATSSIVSLYQAGIIMRVEGGIASQMPVSRADAAQMLYAVTQAVD